MVGKSIRRYFSKEGVDPFSTCKWTFHKVAGLDSPIEAPAQWSREAVEVVATRYFRNETSVRQLFHRVTQGICSAAIWQGRITKEQGEVLADELSYLLIHQMGAFNSPVFFNLGIFETQGKAGNQESYCWNFESRQVEPRSTGLIRPQVSACFIQSVPEEPSDLEGLLNAERRLFGYGSGSGSNFSSIPAKDERSPNGEISKGLLSYLEVFDRSAQEVKSGGTARRAAKMVVLNSDHPEALEFIRWKVIEERKARTLKAQGHTGGMTGSVLTSITGQNSNNSVRVSDEFMTRAKSDKSSFEFELLNEIAKAAWECADPGLQFHDTINRYNPLSKIQSINASNPCSEFMFIDDSACNLASLNLVKFLEREFEWSKFQQAARLFLFAQEILVDWASYPTYKIAENTHRFRPLGLGFTNLGGFLMRIGLAYDSDEARCTAALIAAVMQATALECSSQWAKEYGAFADWPTHKDRTLQVLARHEQSFESLKPNCKIPIELQNLFAKVLKQVDENGLRNAQLTLIAPTGTIGLMMDCDTLGIEPEFSLIKIKELVDGRTLRLVNRSLPESLLRLGYNSEMISQIQEYVMKNGVTTGAPHLQSCHESVFDTAIGGPGARGRRISVSGHLKMMACVQPFLSGGISKTVNVSNDTSALALRDVFIQSWELGLKSVSVYRDGSKLIQPLCVEC